MEFYFTSPSSNISHMPNWMNRTSLGSQSVKTIFAGNLIIHYLYMGTWIPFLHLTLKPRMIVSFLIKLQVFCLFFPLLILLFVFLMLIQMLQKRMSKHVLHAIHPNCSKWKPISSWARTNTLINYTFMSQHLLLLNLM